MKAEGKGNGRKGREVKAKGGRGGGKGKGRGKMVTGEIQPAHFHGKGNGCVPRNSGGLSYAPRPDPDSVFIGSSAMLSG